MRADIYTLPWVQQEASGRLLISTGAQLSALRQPRGVGWRAGRFRREQIYVYIQLILFVVQQNLTQHHRAAIPQFFLFLFLLYFTLQSCIGFAIHWHESTMGVHAFPNMNPPPHNISLGHPHAPARSILYPASDIDWRFVSYMIVYIFQCHSPKSSHPLPLPQMNG